MLASPWCAINDQLLSEASRALRLSGTDVSLFSGNEYIRFALYGDEWCVVEEGIGRPGYTDGFVGSCMSAQRVEPILRRLIDEQYPKQMGLFAC